VIIQAFIDSDQDETANQHIVRNRTKVWNRTILFKTKHL